MNILVVAATSRELIGNQIDDLRLNFKSHKSIDVLITGIGIPNMILSLTNYLARNDVDFLINIGVCGSFSRKIPVGSVVEVVQDEFSEIGYEEGNLFTQFNQDYNIQTYFKSNKTTNLISANAITVNTVHGNEKSIKRVCDRFNPDVESMEGAAFMMVSNYYNKPCLQLRGVSNFIEKRNRDAWNINLAVENSNKELYDIICEL